MTKRIYLKQAVIVEGKYDKIHISQFIDAVIIAVNGFQIFKDKDKQELVRHYAQTTGIIIMTDSDSAGMLIRGKLKGIAGKDAQVYNVYLPEIFGKERRKQAPSKEGKLGAEGIEPRLILEALERCGITSCERHEGERVTMQDLIADGLSGGKNSALMRQRLLCEMGLPQSLTSKAMLEVINTVMTREEYRQLIARLND